MARIVLGALTTLNLGTHLDPQTLDLYGLREKVSTPAFGAFSAYVASSPAITISSTNLVGIGTATPAFQLDVNGTVIGIGTAAPSPGLSGNIRYRDDTATVRWIVGILGSAGATSYSIFDNLAGLSRLTIDSTGNTLINRTTQASGGKLEVGGNLVLQPAAGAPTLGTNGDMSFQLVSNTSLKILVRGSDGVTRSATLTLA